MNKILILILGMVMTCTTAIAETEEGKKADGDRMDKMQENLGLTDQQVAEIRSIRDNGGSKEEMLSVLTRNQLAIMKERRAKMKRDGRKVKRPQSGDQDQTGETTGS